MFTTANIRKHLIPIVKLGIHFNEHAVLIHLRVPVHQQLYIVNVLPLVAVAYGCEASLALSHQHKTHVVFQSMYNEVFNLVTSEFSEGFSIIIANISSVSTQFLAESLEILSVNHVGRALPTHDGGHQVEYVI